MSNDLEIIASVVANPGQSAEDKIKDLEEFLRLRNYL
jgi:hypothetical protein